MLGETDGATCTGSGTRYVYLELERERVQAFALHAAAEKKILRGRPRVPPEDWPGMRRLLSVRHRNRWDGEQDGGNGYRSVQYSGRRRVGGGIAGLLINCCCVVPCNAVAVITPLSPTVMTGSEGIPTPMITHLSPIRIFWNDRWMRRGGKAVVSIECEP
jgi:hypothetical protein